MKSPHGIKGSFESCVSRLSFEDLRPSPQS
jgi:hypothetical protein